MKGQYQALEILFWVAGWGSSNNPSKQYRLLPLSLVKSEGMSIAKDIIHFRHITKKNQTGSDLDPENYILTEKKGHKSFQGRKQINS